MKSRKHTHTQENNKPIRTRVLRAYNGGEHAFQEPFSGALRFLAYDKGKE